MPSRTGGHAWRSVGCSRGCRPAARPYPAMLTGWGRAWMPGVPRTAPVWGGRAPSTPWRALPCRPRGGLRTPRRSPSPAPRRRRPARAPGLSRLVQRMGPAKMGGRLARRGSCVLACARRASHAAWGGALGLPVTAQSPPWRLRRGWRAASTGAAGLGRRATPPGTARAAGAARSRGGSSRWARAPGPCGRRGKRGPAAGRAAVVARQARPPPAGGPPRLAGAPGGPRRRRGLCRRTPRQGSETRGGRPREPVGPPSAGGVCGRPSPGRRACHRARPARCRSGVGGGRRCGGGPGRGRRAWPGAAWAHATAVAGPCPGRAGGSGPWPTPTATARPSAPSRGPPGRGPRAPGRAPSGPGPL